MSRGSPRNGFSLVELSIVLVILGLLTGGILAGQSLIRAAELRAVTAEYQRYQAAVGTFRDHYMAIPGDMLNATRFWNRQVNQSWCVSNAGTAVATPGTCDGNGNGWFNFPANASESGEPFQFWRQLAFAGLIEGNYDGLAGPGSNAHGRIGITVPASRLGNAGWGVFGTGAIVTTDINNFYAGDYSRIFTFGTGGSTIYPYAAAIRPEEAWNIDLKLDDGRPGYGNIRTWRAGGTYTPDCADNASAASAQYNVANRTNACALLFLNAI